MIFGLIGGLSIIGRLVVFLFYCLVVILKISYLSNVVNIIDMSMLIVVWWFRLEVVLNVSLMISSDMVKLILDSVVLLNMFFILMFLGSWFRLRWMVMSVMSLMFMSLLSMSFVMMFYVIGELKVLVSSLLCMFILVFVKVNIGMISSVVGSCRNLCNCLFIEIFWDSL